MGTYDYTILSEQLIFASVTGQLTINSTDKVMLFNYALGADDPLTFDIEVTTNGTTNNRFSLYSEATPLVSRQAHARISFLKFLRKIAIK